MTKVYSPTDEAAHKDPELFNRNIRDDLISSGGKPDLNKTANDDYLNRSNNSIRKQKMMRTPGGRFRGGDPNKSGVMDQSMDQDYLSKIDDIEAQNRSYLAEIEEQK